MSKRILLIAIIAVIAFFWVSSIFSDRNTPEDMKKINDQKSPAMTIGNKPPQGKYGENNYYGMNLNGSNRNPLATNAPNPVNSPVIHKVVNQQPEKIVPSVTQPSPVIVPDGRDRKTSSAETVKNNVSNRKGISIFSGFSGKKNVQASPSPSITTDTTVAGKTSVGGGSWLLGNRKNLTSTGNSSGKSSSTSSAVSDSLPDAPFIADVNSTRDTPAPPRVHTPAKAVSSDLPIQKINPAKLATIADLSEYYSQRLNIKINCPKQWQIKESTTMAEFTCRSGILRDYEVICRRSKIMQGRSAIAEISALMELESSAMKLGNKRELNRKIGKFSLVRITYDEYFKDVAPETVKNVLIYLFIETGEEISMFLFKTPYAYKDYTLPVIEAMIKSIKVIKRPDPAKPSAKSAPKK